MYKKLIVSAPPRNQLVVLQEAVEAFVARRPDVTKAKILSAIQPNIVPLTSEQFASFLTCKKKLAMEHFLPEKMLPQVELSDVVRFDDGILFAELIRKLDRICNAHSTCHVMKGDYEPAAEMTATLIKNYARSMTQKAAAPQGGKIDPRAAEDLIIQRPALSWRPRHARAAPDGTLFEIRSRPAIVRFSMRTKKWTIIDSNAATHNKEKPDQTRMAILAERSMFNALSLTRMIDQILTDPAQRELLLGSNSKSDITTTYSSVICDKTSGVYQIFAHRPIRCTALDFNIPTLKQLSVLVPYQSLMKTAFGGLECKDPMDQGMQITHKKILEMASFLSTTASAAASARDQSPLLRRESSTIQDLHYFLKKNKKNKELVNLEYLPKAMCGSQCVRASNICKFYSPSFCLPQPAEDPVADRDNWIVTVPLLNISLKFELWNRGIRTVSQLHSLFVKGEVPLTPAQKRYVEATSRGQVLVNPTYIRKWLSQLRYPIIFLDFECTAFAVPPFENLRPYDPVPFQFSLNVFHADVMSGMPQNLGYIALGAQCNPSEDPRSPVGRELINTIKDARTEQKFRLNIQNKTSRLQTAKKRSNRKGEQDGSMEDKGVDESIELCKKKGDEDVDIRKARTDECTTISKNFVKKLTGLSYDGCIVAHYATYEKRVLQRLGCDKNMSSEDKSLIETLLFLDTMDLVKYGLVHPASQGSNSLKKILPALCPHLKYDELLEGVESRGDNVAALYRQWRLEMGGDGGSVNSTAKFQGDHATAENIAAAEACVKKWDDIAKALVAYCNLDVRGMWEIVRAATRLADTAERSGKDPDSDGWIALDAQIPLEEQIAAYRASPAEASPTDVNDI